MAEEAGGMAPLASYGWPDLLLVLFTLGWAHGELTDMQHDIRRYGQRTGINKYAHEQGQGPHPQPSSEPTSLSLMRPHLQPDGTATLS